MAQTTRELALARRRAMSISGKAELSSGSNPAPAQGSALVNNPARSVADQSATPTAPAAVTSSAATTAGTMYPSSSKTRALSLARRQAMSARSKTGLHHTDIHNADRHNREHVHSAGIENAVTATGPEALSADSFGMNTPQVPVTTTRSASRARRQAMSSHGKAGIGKNGTTPAQTAHAGNNSKSSRDLSMDIREQRSRHGGSDKQTSRPCGRVRPNRVNNRDAAGDASLKVDASNTMSKQTVTGTIIDRSPDITGNQVGTHRTVTGTQYPGAMATRTSHGNRVTGSRVGRGDNVTGNEPGSCKIVTGDEYINVEQQHSYCSKLTQKSPRRTSMAETMKGRNMTDTSATLRGSSITGTMVGRRKNMTGDEAGSCHNITGDDYIGREQYSDFCDTVPSPDNHGADISTTNKGNAVTGTVPGRSSIVTGDEPGTCKAVTGTPYAGLKQASDYCETSAVTEIQSRTRLLASTPGPAMTGQQPGIGGAMTGTDKGACEPVTGTPYVGADQFVEACPATATTAGPDSRQSSGGNTPWGQFSVTQPSGGAARYVGATGVTGNCYESGHNITGPFGMAEGRVSGTEEARFGNQVQTRELPPVVAEKIEGRIKARITGEGQDAGLRITGDGWERNQHVTGTEGRSAVMRNPTMRMGMAAAMRVEQKRNEALPIPNSKVTGGSGNTDKGSLITYSGGARG